ncbi:16S rRNA (guanine(527)-N(7))-methyltransferase RsmG [Candidatus Caldatribacterium sp. SIUC1]|uniref:16S rRNA (guanine(527)-N(7))-methyltransferase RsmG n=1 Tax=Candidatus Caldatribacterium sp. SIUC1 TaxID=3418365 RepID=UPI003F69271B
MDNLKNVLREGRAFLGVSLSEEQEERILLFVRLLNEANRSLNLTGFKTEEDILVEGILDSLTALALEDLVFVGESLLDVGTGGGIPGIPLKIARPSLKLTMVEATAKKCRFLETTLRALGLEDVDVLCERAETLAHHPSLRERFDLVTARALGSLREVLELTTPFLRCGGLAFYYKGREAEKEVEEARKALEVLHCSVRTLQEVAIPFRSRKTTLVLVEKKAPTPPSYPRRPGIPKKRPL